MNVKFAFAYADAAALAATKEFHVYQADATTHVRGTLAPLLVIPPNSIPTITSPATVTLAGYGQTLIEVVAVDTQGKEGISAFVSTYILLPGPQAMSIVG